MSINFIHMKWKKYASSVRDICLFTSLFVFPQLTVISESKQDVHFGAVILQDSNHCNGMVLYKQTLNDSVIYTAGFPDKYLASVDVISTAIKKISPFKLSWYGHWALHNTLLLILQIGNQDIEIEKCSHLFYQPIFFI